MGRMAGDQAGLLLAVCAAPDDDTPRLVYADWLEENGRPDRARFIRLQVEHARPSETPFPRVYAQARAAAIGGLLGLYRREWVRELPKWAWSHYRDDGPGFERGFVGRMRVLTAAFVRHGGQLVERTPVTAVAFDQAGKLAVELAACPWLGRLREVSLAWEPFDDWDAGHLFRSGHLAAVEELDLTGTRVTDAGLKALARSGGLPNLRVLRVGCTVVSEPGVRALSESRYRERLRVVDVRMGPRVRDAADRLARECRFAVEV